MWVTKHFYFLQRIRVNVFMANDKAMFLQDTFTLATNFANSLDEKYPPVTASMQTYVSL